MEWILRTPKITDQFHCSIDYKIFAKILSDRLKQFLKNFIKEDQAVFLPGRQIRDNLRILIDSVEYYDKRIEKKRPPNTQFQIIF